MHIVTTGSREWTDMNQTHRGLLMALRLVADGYTREEEKSITLIHGGARGADTLAARAAEERGWQIGEYKADWSKYGKSAGHIRNQRMIDDEQPILCVAYLIPELPCRGTRDMMQRCALAGIPVLVIPGAKHR